MSYVANTLLLYGRSKRHIIIWWSKRHFLNYITLPSNLVLWLILSGSNYPCLEQIYIVTNMFELLRFDCITFLYGDTRRAESYRMHIYQLIHLRNAYLSTDLFCGNLQLCYSSYTSHTVSESTFLQVCSVRSKYSLGAWFWWNKVESSITWIRTCRMCLMTDSDSQAPTNNWGRIHQLVWDKT